ncbi:DUF1442 domain-containing protein [Neorhizobium sp. NCHU2750]|uniref:O-methyltransferase n=1 Tax=Neorhizobium sp. NCHU2750 TaxID=1825976 RepID=UPI000E741CD3|nr:methyltransferase [Neorhizobium sp. NCHU2750]
MDDKILAVLETYHEMITREKNSPRIEVPGGRDGGNDMRLRAVGPQTGQLINILASGLKAPTIVELGTSFGYSAIWLAQAARATGGRVITMELHQYKADFARDMAEKAGLADYIDFRVGDAVAMIGDISQPIDFVLVDLWKDLYLPCLKAFHPKLSHGAIVVADNISPGRAMVADYVEAIRALPDMRSLTLPVGEGIEVSRKS